MEFDARRQLGSVGGVLARGSRARDLRRHAVVAGALRPSSRARPVDGGFVVDGRWSDARTATWQHRFRSSRRVLIRGMRRRNFTNRHAASIPAYELIDTEIIEVREDVMRAALGFWRSYDRHSVQ